MNLRSKDDVLRTRTQLYCRLAIPLLTLVLALGSLAAAPKKAPSSLDKPGATVRFTHSHERVASCKLSSDGHACLEQRVPAMAGAQVALAPAPSDLISQSEPKRETMNIALPSRQGSSTLPVRMESGNWALSWADQHVLLYVDPQRDFDVRLMSVSGACTAEKGQCRRRDDSISRKVVVPPQFLGPH
jgi:hypothetical protein